MAPKKATDSASAPVHTHWLLKAEPESRLEKGIDVKFSVDDFERVGVTSWEGVRNHQAKNFLKDQMKVGQRALFYHSSCKIPGVAGLAKVKREGYPDHNAWDPKHPYYDAKSDPDKPVWFMVDLEFVSRLPHHVPLALLQHLATLTSPPSETPYLTQRHMDGIRDSVLVKKGRLSVQPATEEFYEAVELLGTKGGFEELVPKKGKAKSKAKATQEAEDDKGHESEEEEKPKKGKGTAKAPPKKRPSKAQQDESDDAQDSSDEVMPTGSSSRPSKRAKTA